MKQGDFFEVEDHEYIIAGLFLGSSLYTWNKDDRIALTIYTKENGFNTNSPSDCPHKFSVSFMGPLEETYGKYINIIRNRYFIFGLKEVIKQHLNHIDYNLDLRVGQSTPEIDAIHFPIIKRQIKNRILHLMYGHKYSINNKLSKL